MRYLISLVFLALASGFAASAERPAQCTLPARAQPAFAAKPAALAAPYGTAEVRKTYVVRRVARPASARVTAYRGACGPGG